MQWNINGFYNNYEYLQELISKENAQIICLQETNLKNNEILKTKNFNCYNKNRLDCKAASGGVGILIYDKIYSQELQLTTNLEAIAVTIKIKNKTITICNIYLSNRNGIDLSTLQELISQLPTPFLLLGDCNSHSALWGSYKTDNRGKIIEELLTNNDMILLNDSSPTHFNIANTKNSAIDLSFCSSNIATCFDWQARDSLYGSDHYPIIISFENDAEETTDIIQARRFIFQKADWKMYKETVEQNISELDKAIEHNTYYNTSTIDKLIEKFMDITLKAANASIPKTGINNKAKYATWWNNDCEIAIKNAKAALNKYKRKKTLDTKIEFKRLKAISKRTVKQAKSQAWIEFLNSINQQIPNKEIWNKIKSIDGKNKRTHITALHENNEIITDPSKIANILAENFASNSSDNNHNNEFLAHKELIENSSDLGTEESKFISQSLHINEPITYQELLEVVKSSKNTSPGPDGIPNILLKNLPTSMYTRLLKIYNIIWDKKLYPSLWKQATVIPINKPGKNKANKDSYRPIALTCCLCKILEKIVNKRLREYLEKQNIIHKYQSGFREKCSTTDCLVTLETNICNAFNNNQHVVAVCLDMEKAYDLIWRRRVLEILIKHNITNNMYFFIKNFLFDRTIKVKVNNSYSRQIEINNGVPQGSVISVTIFLLAINDISNYAIPPSSITMFADDVTLFVKGKNLKTTQ